MNDRLPVTIAGLLFLTAVVGVVFSRTLEEPIQKTSQVETLKTPFEITPVQAQRRHFIYEMDVKLGGFRVLADPGELKLIVNADKWNSLSPDDQKTAASVALAYVNWAPEDKVPSDQPITVFDINGFTQIGSFDQSGYANL